VIYSRQAAVRRLMVRSQQQGYYNALWSNSKVVEPSAWALWDTIKAYTAGSGQFLEIGAGTRPRIPIADSFFLDLSPRAMEALSKREAHCAAGSAEALPFPEDCFDLICAFEIVEHVPNDRAVLLEARRVLKDGRRFVFSVPLHMAYWSRHDELAGHVRRYDPSELDALLRECGLPIEKYHVTLSPRNSWYRNGSALLASKFWRLSVALERSLALPFYCWIDRRRGIVWKEGHFAKHTRQANNVIIVCRKS
jgi:SAM-dependent methyltransferase